MFWGKNWCKSSLHILDWNQQSCVVLHRYNSMWNSKCCDLRDTCLWNGRIIYGEQIIMHYYYYTYVAVFIGQRTEDGRTNDPLIFILFTQNMYLVPVHCPEFQTAYVEIEIRRSNKICIQMCTQKHAKYDETDIRLNKMCANVNEMLCDGVHTASNSSHLKWRFSRSFIHSFAAMLSYCTLCRLHRRTNAAATAFECALILKNSSLRTENTMKIDKIVLLCYLICSLSPSKVR